MKNPHPENLPLELVERLAACIPQNKDSLATIGMVLDLEGYDTSDEAWVRAVRKRAAWIIRDERAGFGAVSALIEMRLSNEQIGKAIGMPKSTVQAMGAGRVVERLTEDQRARMHKLLNLMNEQLDTVRAALGR